MKKIGIFLMLMVALISCNETQAQITLYKSTSGTIATITSITTDTLTNADSTWFVSRAGALNAKSEGRYIAYFTMDTVSGTTTPGNVVQQGSYDGTTWFNLNGGSVVNMTGVGMGIDGANCDTLTWAVGHCANKVNQVYTRSGTGKFVYATSIFNVAPRVLYYRLKFVSSGTQSTRIYNVSLLAY